MSPIESVSEPLLELYIIIKPITLCVINTHIFLILFILSVFGVISESSNSSFCSIICSANAQKNIVFNIIRLIKHKAAIIKFLFRKR